MKLLKVCVLSFALLSTGMAHAEDEAVELSEIVVTANRYEISDNEAPAYVTVIGRDEIEHSNARTVSDLLKNVPGVFVTDTGLAKTAIVDIRGSGGTAASNVLLLVNNRKVNPVDISGPDWLQIPKDSIERIEIVRGAGTVLYGDNAVGGVVNIITKKGQGGKPPVKVGGKYGSYESSLANMEVGGKVDQFSYYVYSDYSDTKGYRKNSNELNKNFNARLGYAVTPQVDFDVITTWHEDDYRLPSGLNAAEIRTLGRRATTTPNDYASTKDRSVQLAMTLSPLEDNEAGVFNIDYSFRNRDTFGHLDFGFGDYGTTKRTIDTHGLTGKYSLDANLAERDLNLVAGTDYYRSKNHILGNNYGSFPSTDNLFITKEEIAGYLSADYELVDQIFFNAGTRYQKAYYTFDRPDISTYDKQNPHKTASMAGLRYQYAEKSNVYLNAQQTFRFLATDEFYSTFSGLNTSLRPQKGWQYEAGIKHNVTDTVTLHATPYYIENKDEIFYEPLINFGFGDNSNYDRTKRMGVEVGQELDILKLVEISGFDGLEFFTNYTYQDPEFGKGTFKGKDIPMAPRNLASTGIKTVFLKNVHWSLTGNYVGSSYAINDAINALPKVKAYFIAETRVSWEQKNWELFFGVNNLFDKKYFNYTVAQANGGTNSDYYPAPERNYNVGMNLKF